MWKQALFLSGIVFAKVVTISRIAERPLVSGLEKQGRWRIAICQRHNEDLENTWKERLGFPK